MTDKVLWVLIRRVRRDWQRHLVLVTPDTVIRWNRAGVAAVLALEVAGGRRAPRLLRRSGG